MPVFARDAKNDRDRASWTPPETSPDASDQHGQRELLTDETTLSQRPTTWEGFFAALKEAQAPDDFLDAQERAQEFEGRDPFAGWRE